MLEVNQKARIRSALAPMQAESRVSSPQTSQVLGGHVVTLLEQTGDWWKVESADGYHGWINRGYLEAATGEEKNWSTSIGALLHDGSRVRALPVGARFNADAATVEGDSVDASHMHNQFPPNYESLLNSALALFDGARYEWGGVSNWGCDCSGLVQTVFALHGKILPRDAYQQFDCGTDTALKSLNPEATAAKPSEGDLLFFSDRDDKRITHVGIAMKNNGMIHSALGRGGVALENLASDEPYVVTLRSRFIGARRIELTK